MIRRCLTDKLLDVARRAPVVTLAGPRQSGKTTLARAAFPQFAYVNLDVGDQKQFAQDDPRGFLDRHPDGVILDEVQSVPELLPYIQERVDLPGPPGCRYLLTGSQNLSLREGVSQSLAGRSIQLELLPFSLEELASHSLTASDPWTALWKGGYPRLHTEGWQPGEWLPSYIQNYLERDVRQLAQIGDLSRFQLFLQLCAGRIGQLLNLSSLGNEVGADHKTIARWISILEASYVVTLLRPHHANFHKRLVKTPKLYFLDTGLACSLLRIRNASDLDTHHMRGNLFENFAITELLKNRLNEGQKPSYWFWRDSSGHEVDLVSEESGRLRAVEIKGSATLHSSHFDGLEWFARLAGDQLESRHLVHAGSERYVRSGVEVIGWPHLATVRI